MKPKLKQRIEKTLVMIVAALSLTAILQSLEFNLLEAKLYDFRSSVGNFHDPSEDIILITLDNRTTEALDDFAPLALDLHSKLLTKISAADPKGVGYLIDMAEVAESNPEHFQGSSAQSFISTAEGLAKKGVPFIMGTRYDVTGEVLPPFPLSSLPHALARIHKDGNVFAKDKVSRRALVRFNGLNTFHQSMAEKLGYVKPGSSPAGSYSLKRLEAEFFFPTYHGSTKMDLETGKAAYPTYSFVDVLNGKVSASKLKNKIILVGTVIKQNSNDFAFTPESKKLRTNPKLIVHANILDSIIHKHSITRLSAWIDWIATFIVISIVLVWVMTLKPATGVIAMLSLSAAVLLISHTFFEIFDIWVKEARPLIGVFLAYYLAVPYRLIQEYKQRWEYQKANQLLMQVEEMKNNFLQLVTHDLKTPVARIQGLAEVLRRYPDDKEKLLITTDGILDSTSELNNFISAILELHRIDSNRFNIRLESKDINTVIERAVANFKAQADADEKSIETNLEPLFPVKIDQILITKVINNLIDNALKYSPKGSVVRVSSIEVGEHVEISISDEGIGLDEHEITNLFARFYRVKNDQTTKIPGTGLGLYLTKFFIKAHKGKVEVTSTKGSGSTFKILLPNDPDTLPKLADDHTQPGLKVGEFGIEKVANNENKEK